MSNICLIKILKIMNYSNLFQFSVLYKNNERTGIAITLNKSDFPNLQEIVSTAINHYNEIWENMEKESPNELIAGKLFKELEKIAANKSNFSNKNMVDLIGIVMVLVERGWLQNDEFNGVNAIYNKK